MNNRHRNNLKQKNKRQTKNFTVSKGHGQWTLNAMYRIQGKNNIHRQLDNRQQTIDMDGQNDRHGRERSQEHTSTQNEKEIMIST